MFTMSLINRLYTWTRNPGNTAAFESAMKQFGKELTGDMMKRAGKSKLLDYVARFLGGL